METTAREKQLAAIATFRELHASGCFVLPNPWDRGSAIALADLGFRALASTSAGAAFSRGLPDAIGAMPREVVLEHLKVLVAATRLPVSADFQEGYAADAAGVAESVALCIETGVAGLSIEDATNDASAPLFPREAAIERVVAARRAIDAAGAPVLLTARCEAYLVGAVDPQRVVLDRLVAFAEAGADCLYAPGVQDLGAISEIVRAVAPRPVNVLVGRADPALTVARLGEIGVRRVSVGAALARAAWGAFLRAARGIAETGTFETLEGAASYVEIDRMFRAASR